MQVSLIIPTHNRKELLSRTLKSVFHQTELPNQIIVVDDGSTDDTKTLCDFFDIKYVFQKNQGVSSARNHGIQLAKYEWICFLDSDDIWESEKLEKQKEFHRNHPHILFSHTDELWLFNDKIIKQKKHQLKPEGFCFEKNISNTLIGASTVMIHKTIFENIGLFDERLIACEDFDLWLRILEKYELGYIDKKLIQKIAGHKNQLSFTTALIDTYKIKALLKHTKGSFALLIHHEIIKKCDILIKGAKKHKNQEIEQQYTQLQLLSRNKI